MSWRAPAGLRAGDTKTAPISSGSGRHRRRRRACSEGARVLLTYRWPQYVEKVDYARERTEREVGVAFGAR